MTRAASSARPGTPAATTFRRMRRHLPPHLALAGKLAGGGAVEISGDGCRVQLDDGRSVLDFGAYGVTILGHRHPRVLDAVRAQLDALPVGTRTLANPWTAAAAARLADYLDSPLKRVYLGLGGADAVEAAVKLARLASGRNRVIAVDGAFHGKSLGALSLTHHERYRSGLAGLLPGVVHVSPDDPSAVARALDAGDVAAFIFEPVQGENGVRVLDPAVLSQWCEAVAQRGGFVIADEIQTGLRRCGEPSLAVAAGLEVDAVLLGKPLGGGVLPLSAVVCSERLYAPLIADPMVHTATFSGYPLACAVLPAALEAIEELADRGRAIAEIMRNRLATIAGEHSDLVTAVRGRGLLWGLEMRSAEITSTIIVNLARAGLVVSQCMSCPRTLRLLPPLVADDADVAEALALVSEVLSREDPGRGREGAEPGPPVDR